nr:MAG TPA: hypothetical protein [Caudoviricetes sp.]
MFCGRVLLSSSVALRAFASLRSDTAWIISESTSFRYRAGGVIALSAPSFYLVSLGITSLPVDINLSYQPFAHCFPI